MKMNSSFLKLWVAVALMASVVVAFAQPKDKDPISAAEKKDVLARIESTLTQWAFVPGIDFKQWPAMVEKESAAIEKAQTAGEFTNLINRVMNSYGFSHIVLFSPEAGQARNTQSRAGIGIRIEIDEKGIRVLMVFPESPAADVGLQPGDLIIEADGKPVRQQADLAGGVGDTSKIVIMRGTERLEKTVTRRQYSTIIPETVEWKGDIAILKIPTFDAGYNISRIDSLMREIKEKGKGVVLDLRGNGGGRVTNLQHLASFFLNRETQPMGTFVGKSDLMAYEKQFGPSTDAVAVAATVQRKVTASLNRGGVKLEMPVSVLIDGGSGSASEIMAGAMREQLGAKLYGRKSAGAVLASLIRPLGDDLGFMLQFPMTDYVTIKGLRIEGNGIVPDKDFPVARFGEPDGALDAAIAELSVLIKK